MTLDRLSNRVNRLVEYAVFGLGLGMALLVAAQVFCRYALNHSLFWSEELARFLLVWLTFLGAGVVYRRAGHPGVDLLSGRLGLRRLRALKVAVHLLSLAFFLIMVIYGWEFAWFVRFQVSASLYIPKWIPHAIVPLSGAILSLHAINFIWSEIRAALGGEAGR